MTDAEAVELQFKKIGARVKFRTFRPASYFMQGRAGARNVAINIPSDRLGEFFEISRPVYQPPELAVLQIDVDTRSLLLCVNQAKRFLCGHDDRRWFVAPVFRPVSTIADAKKSLNR